MQKENSEILKNQLQNLKKLQDYKQKQKFNKEQKKQINKNPVKLVASDGDLFTQTEQYYEKQAKQNLKNYSISKSDELWMRKIMESGTFKDKVSAFCIYIRDNQKFSLKTVENLIAMCKNTSKRENITAVNSVRDIFIEVLFKQFQNHSFNQYLKLSKDHEVKTLLNYYISDKLKAIFQQFIRNLEEKLQDPLPFYRQQVLKIIIEIFQKCPDQEKEALIYIIMNKFGDNDKKIINQLMMEFSKPFSFNPHLVKTLIKATKIFVLRPNQSQKAQYYALNWLCTLDLKKFDQETLLEMIQFNFQLLHLIIQSQQDSKILSQILKNINRIFPLVKHQNFEKCQQFFSEQMENLYRLVHSSENSKIKIQTILFIFQILQAQNQLSDRYFRLLYDLILDTEIFYTSLNEILFDLIFYSLKDDTNQNRIKSFIKRILQCSIYVDTPLTITILLFIQRIFQIHNGLQSMFSNNEKFYLQDDIENFKDVDSNEQQQKEEEKYEIKYDPFKREPLYSQAETTCLWEINCLCRHYHPTVKKYANDLLKGVSFNYGGNPLLDFQVSNFLDRFSFKKAKKQEKGGLVKLKQKNKLRMSKIEDPLNAQDQDFRQDEQFFAKYFKHKREQKIQEEPKQQEEDSEGDIDEFADELFEKEMKQMNGEYDDEDDDGFDDFLQSIEEDEEQSDEEDLDGKFQDMMETSGIRDGHEVEKFRKDKKMKKMTNKLKKNKDRFKENDKHIKKKVKK